MVKVRAQIRSSLKENGIVCVGTDGQDRKEGARYCVQLAQMSLSYRGTQLNPTRDGISKSRL